MKRSVSIILILIAHIYSGLILAENRLIREDREWLYRIGIPDVSNYNYDMVALCFSGTTEIEGKIYSNCYLRLYDDPSADNEKYLIAYMREDAGRIFMRHIPGVYSCDILIPMGLGPDTIDFYGKTSSYWLEGDYERLIYDFNLGQSDRMWVIPSVYLDKGIFVIAGRYESEFNDIPYLAQLYCPVEIPDSRDFKYYATDISGSYIGLLPFPGASSIQNFAVRAILAEVKDGNGVTIFDPAKANTGIHESVDVKKECVAIEYFDLQGRRINNPEECNVYIKVEIFNDGSAATSKILRAAD